MQGPAWLLAPAQAVKVAVCRAGGDATTLSLSRLLLAQVGVHGFEGKGGRKRMSPGLG